MADATKKLKLHKVATDQVHSIIGRSMLKDGFPFVVDLDKSEGSYLVDKVTGKRTLDFFNYFATQPLGHNHPAMTDPEFMEHIGRVAITNPSNSDFYTEDMAAFVDMLHQTAQPKSLPHLFMVSGGALAVENAMKTAFDWKFQKRAARGLPDDEDLSILHFREAFHGRTGYTMSLTNTEANKVRWFPKFDWPRVSNPKIVFPLEDNLAQVEEAEERSLAEIRSVFEHAGDRVAGVIVEPIQGEGGDNHFRSSYMHALREITRDNEALLIVDEVQTGVGTTGTWWAHEHHGIKPDVLCFGKKMQVCGILAGPRVDEVDSVFSVSSRINSTWGGSLVDMVRATRYLQVIEAEGLVQNAAERGEQFLVRLWELAGVHPHLVSNVRGKGLFVAFTLPTREQRDRLLDVSREHGMMALASGPNSVRFRPPLTVSSAEIEQAVEILDTALALL